MTRERLNHLLQDKFSYCLPETKIDGEWVLYDIDDDSEYWMRFKTLQAIKVHFGLGRTARGPRRS
jgi:hypothetical protein